MRKIERIKAFCNVCYSIANLQFLGFLLNFPQLVRRENKVASINNNYMMSRLLAQSKTRISRGAFSTQNFILTKNLSSRVPVWYTHLERLFLTAFVIFLFVSPTAFFPAFFFCNFILQRNLMKFISAIDISSTTGYLYRIGVLHWSLFILTFIFLHSHSPSHSKEADYSRRVYEIRFSKGSLANG